MSLRCSRTAQQGLVASVCSRQWARTLLTLVQNSAQMARVTEAADSQAVQVDRLHKVAQQGPLEAQNVPPERKSRRKRGRINGLMNK